MKTSIIRLGFVALAMLTACTADNSQKKSDNMGIINQSVIKEVVATLAEAHGKENLLLIEKGVGQVAALWLLEDGNEDEFRAFCTENYIGNKADRHQLFERLSANYEVLWGHMNQMSLELNKPLHLDLGPILPVDVKFGSYSPYAHLADDFFGNKIAFLTILNFPYFSLEEKAGLGTSWTRREWAYARMGDVFTSRVPSGINQESSRVGTEADNYISEYNIMMGRLLDNSGASLFPENMRLISHWGLRDEIKSNYGNPQGLPRQEMIYQVMLRIIHQEIPEAVINNPEYQWNPFTNETLRNGSPVSLKREPDTRYQHLLNSFHAARQADPYSPNYPTAIMRAFDAGLELSMEEVEELFRELVGSPLLKEIGALISQRLGRPLKPFDIWYDGFKARSSISEEQLNEKVRQKYPNRDAFEADLPNILVKLGWSRARAQELASKIVVEASRGAGHAWGAQMRSQKSHLRTRIGENGMDYKGYNIAIHEFGHNVEQTISLHDVDYYMMNGVPNTAFTEALAFIFQVRDLELLGMGSADANTHHLRTLDNFWGRYEIMGVSLVDMGVWR